MTRQHKKEEREEDKIKKGAMTTLETPDSTAPPWKSEIGKSDIFFRLSSKF